VPINNAINGGALMRIAALCLVLLAVTDCCADSKLERETLKGLGGVQVLVEEIHPAVARRGLTARQIQTDTELTLRRFGVNVLSKDESRKTPAKAWLSVWVNCHVRENTVAFHLMVSLNQTVTLVTGKKHTVRQRGKAPRYWGPSV